MFNVPLVQNADEEVRVSGPVLWDGTGVPQLSSLWIRASKPNFQERCELLLHVLKDANALKQLQCPGHDAICLTMIELSGARGVGQ